MMNVCIKSEILVVMVMILLFLVSCSDSGKLSESEAESSASTQTENLLIETTNEAVKPVEVPISSTFYSKKTMDTIRYNVINLMEFKAAKNTAVKNAEYFMNLSYDELWEMVFGPELDRSWMVHSNGYCPKCKEPVIMYDWIIDPVNRPWKLECPKCHDLFPKNDFGIYYKSGLDHEGRFSYDRADSSLLFNAETGDKNDKFGVDDGNGYVEGQMTFRFVQTYLVYGQWMKTLLAGINSLSTAYIYTQDSEYAVRTLILLDRLADFWPEFDFAEQGWLYDAPAYCNGYISYIINSAFECYDLALAYDKTKEVLYTQPVICEFLSSKAKITEIDNQKETPDDVKRNIDERILKDLIQHPEKLDSNPPYTDLALFAARAVLDWEGERESLEKDIESIIEKNTLYDGLNGESGLHGYATMSKGAIANICNLFTLADSDFINKMFDRCPKLYDAYRFHIDLHCVGRYYPIIGDVGYFGENYPSYPASAGKEEILMLYKLYELTGDEDMLRTICKLNGGSPTGAFQLFPALEDVKEKNTLLKEVVSKDMTIDLDSIRKDEWQIAVLRTGEAGFKTEVWLNFGRNKISHDHGDGMNIGIYYQDADMMPDNGYPNVAYGGGWYSDEVLWTVGTLSHNVVSFNRQDQGRANGKITLWSIDDLFKVVRANMPNVYANVKKYERTIALVDINKASTYVVDVFRVGGAAGTYEKYNRSNISSMKTTGLELNSVEREYQDAVYMSNFQEGKQIAETWTADWSILNYFNSFTNGYNMHLKMLDFTRGDNVFLCDSWLPPSMGMKSNGHEGFQLPTTIIEKQVAEHEIATYVSIMEPYSRESKITGAKRLPCMSGLNQIDVDRHIALEIQSVENFTDVVILLDPDIEKEFSDVSVETKMGNIRTDAQSCLLRFDPSGKPVYISASAGSYLMINETEYEVME